MRVVLYSSPPPTPPYTHTHPPKDILHHSSVFLLITFAGLKSLYHPQQWLPLMTRTLLVKSSALLLPHPGFHQNPPRTLPCLWSLEQSRLDGHNSYWNGWALLQLCTQCQDRNGSQCSIMVTLDTSEVEALGRNIARAENLLQEHNARTHDVAACLLFR